MLKSMTISEMAARWYLKMREQSLDLIERAEFEQWLEKDPRHGAEYESIVQAMQKLRSPDFLSTIADEAERSAFLAAEERRKSKQTRIGQLVVVCLLSLLSVLFYHQYQDWQESPVMQMAAQNPVGRIEVKTLDDGTKITLSAKSDMEITYYRNHRHVLLIEGEAIFEVAKDKKRPFIVETDTARITVLGTRFVVNRLNHLVRVSVDHGKVKVEPKFDYPRQSEVESRVITNGQVVEVYPNHATVMVNRPASDAFAFLSGRLVFDRADVSEIATTVSRYHVKPVLGIGNEIHNISADINIRNLDQFIHGLPNIATVSIKDTPQYILISSKQLPVSNSKVAH